MIRSNTRFEFGCTVATVAVALIVASRMSAQSTTAQEMRAQPEHAALRSFNRALGVECSHCHADADFKSEAKPTFDFARRMEAMVRGLNTGPLSGMPASRTPSAST